MYKLKPPVQEFTPEATTYSPEELQLIVADHALWLETAGKSGKRANLRGVDLKKADLSRVNLTDANIRGADLSGANFKDAILKNVDLSEAILPRSSLRGAVLCEANLSRANLRYADLQNVDLTGANLTGTMFEGASMVGANLRAANGREVDLNGAILKNATLVEANLRNANLNDAVLYEADLSQADCRDASFERATFEKAKLRNTVFRGANLDHVDFGHADFSEAFEVAPEYHAQSFIAERRKLQQEQESLQRVREEISDAEQKLLKEIHGLEQQKALIQDLRVKEEDYLQRYQSKSRWFKTTAMIWALVTLVFTWLLVSLASEINFAKLKVVEISLVFGLVTFVLWLFIDTAIRSFEVYRLIEQYGGFHHHKITSLKNAGTTVVREVNVDPKAAPTIRYTRAEPSLISSNRRVTPTEEYFEDEHGKFDIL